MPQDIKIESARWQRSLGSMVDGLCDDFECLWRKGERPPVQEYLDRADPACRDQLLRELLHIEVQYRRRQGDAPELAELLARFPSDAGLVQAVFETTGAGTATFSRPSTTEPETSVTFETRCSSLAFHDRGGLGEVYRAEDSRLSRPMALKFIHWTHLANVDACERFRVEAEVTSRLDHPGVVPVYGMGEGREGRPFYAMRFIEGENLRKAIDRYHSEDWDGRGRGARRLELHQLLEHVIAACDTLAYAHNRGVVHRDIKPENIMLGKYRETLVVDWGLAQFIERDLKAKASGEETLMPGILSKDSHGSDSGAGTIGYISPEQLPGSTLPGSPASDVYSLGATLYKLLTGQPPFHASDGHRVWEKIRTGDFPRPRRIERACPPALEAVCLKAMALKPEDRYASASDLATDLRRWMADEPVACYRERLVERLARCARRHRAWSFAVAATAAVVLLAAVAASLAFRTAAHKEQLLRVQADQLRAEAHEARIANLRTTAAFAAKSYAIAVDNAWQRLEALAADPRLAELLLDAAKRQDDSQQWADLQTWLATKTTDHLVQGLADCWFINDSRGIQVARNPVGDTIGKPFHDRSYFHGGDVDLDENSLAVGSLPTPTRHPTVSAAYRSRTDTAHRVAFSVPIWADSGKADPPIGVLVMSVPLHRLTKHLGLEIGDQLELALIDLGGDTLETVPATGLILEHPDLAAGDVVRITETALLDRLRRLRQLGVRCAREQQSDQAKPRLAAQMHAETVDRRFTDPIAAEQPHAVAAFWPVITAGGGEGSRDAQWVVVIRECTHALPESSEAGYGAGGP